MKTVSVIALAMLATVVLAQTGMRPGQWEVTTRMEMPGMPAGFQMPAMTMAQCITPEQAKDPATTVTAQNGRGRGGKSDCKTSDFKSSGSTTTWSFACTSPEKMSGTGEMTFAGDDSYTNTLKMVTAQGAMTMRMTGKRTGDCAK